MVKYILLSFFWVGFAVAVSAQDKKDINTNAISFYDVVNKILSADLALSEEQQEKITYAASIAEGAIVNYFRKLNSEGGVLKGEALRAYQTFLETCEGTLDKTQLTQLRKITAKIDPKKIIFQVSSNL